MITYLFILPPFSPQFRGIQLLVVTILSHRFNSRTGSGETKVESHASSKTQPNQAKPHCFLTQRASNPEASHTNVSGLGPGDLVSVHCARPTTGVASARFDKDIPTGQTLPNPDDARPVVAG
jgi:hypothetical protein